MFAIYLFYYCCYKYILFSSCYSHYLHTSLNFDLAIRRFDKAWIISFIIFFLIHIFDITYFDGRISTLAWILLSGMRSIIREYSVSEKIDSI